MVKTLTASAKNPSPCWPSHLEGARRLWQGEEVAAGCFGCSFGAVGSLGGSLCLVIYAPGAGLCWDAGGTPALLSLVGHRQAGDGGDMALLLGKGGLQAPCTRSEWPRCNRMSRRCSRWTCQLLSVLTPLWVPPRPLGPGGPPPVPLRCVCLEQGGWEVTVCLQSPSDKQGPFHVAVPPWQTPCFVNFNGKKTGMCICPSVYSA